MWKAIVVEDEDIVRETVIRMTPWDQLGFEIVGEAADGFPAMELIRRHRVDVVVSDIVMPRMDGLHLLKQAREEGYDTRFIMLTCMNEFEFAQQALEYGASSYILKLSMDVDRMKQALAKVGQELAGMKQNKMPYDIPLLDQISAMWNSVLFLEQPSRSIDDTVGAWAQRHGFVQAFVIAKLHGTTRTPELNLDAFADPRELSIFPFTAMGQTTWFCWSRKRVRIDLLNALAHHDTAFAEVPRPDDLSHVFHEVLGKLTDYWYAGVEPSPPDHTTGASRQPLWEMEKEWTKALELDTAETCIGKWDRLWHFFARERVLMPVVKRIAVQMLGTVAKVSSSAPVDADILLAKNHREVYGILHAAILDGFARRSRMGRSVTDHHEINAVLDNIHQAYREEITLKQMAKLVAIEEHYLSALFKKKTGLTFVRYLRMVRLDKAKTLLKETDLPLSDIAEKVGLLSDQYMIRVFKSEYGMTPGEYRRSAKPRPGS